MNLTPEHGRAFGYWRTPLFIREACKLRPPDIHQLVNLNAGIKLVNAVNALFLIKLKRHNSGSALQALTPDDWSRRNAPKRYYAMLRWRRKLLASRVMGTE